MDDAISFLKEVLSIPTVNGKDDEGRLAEFLCDYFKKAGIAASLQRIDETHANVIARLEGEDDQKTIVWNGHLDTVPYGDLREWHTDPDVAVERDGFVYARGAADMKSGLAAMVYALCDLHKNHRKPACSILFLGTCDEEKGGLGARKALEAYRNEPWEGILIGEPTGGRLGIAQKGCIWLEMTVTGRASHGAYPLEGTNAILHGMETAKQICAYVEGFSHPVLKNATAQITQIQGGTAPNMTPDTCVILLDIRTVPGLTKDMIAAKAHKLIEAYRAEKNIDLAVSLQIKNEREAIEITKDNHLTVRLKDCLLACGLPESYMGINYFTDGSILTAQNPETGVLLFGPGEPEMAHKPNERVELAAYQKAIEVFTLFVLRK